MGCSGQWQCFAAPGQAALLKRPNSVFQSFCSTAPVALPRSGAANDLFQYCIRKILYALWSDASDTVQMLHNLKKNQESYLLTVPKRCSFTDILLNPANLMGIMGVSAPWPHFNKCEASQYVFYVVGGWFAWFRVFLWVFLHFLF